ncbi:MAG: hypothetical protein PHO09_02250 [Sphaerochaeta sp.]|nr:hypothetical protein [Sphaerochaeta sp.]
MEAIWILTVIFTFIIVISSIDNRHNLKKKKIDAAIRMQEMEMGIPPGTYSGFKPRKRPVKGCKKSKGMEDEDPMGTWKRETDRADLKKGIDNLQQRLENIETIMNSRREKTSGFNEKE